MRVTVLRASSDGGAGGLVRYFDPDHRRSAAVAYYAEVDGEPDGRWFGSGCEAVGLAGRVQSSELGAMLDARHPQTGERLGRGFGDRSARAFDATFSAPKSVSLLWALSPDEQVRRDVLAAHDAAVDAVLGWFETWGAVTRRGRDGIAQVDTGGVCAALFRQHTSRADDPQLHTHAVIWSKVQDPTGKWLALDARFLLKQQFTLSWLYDAALRTELTRRLGVDWEPLEAGRGQTELAVVPAALRDLFSQRTEQVDAKLAELVRRWSADHDGADPDRDTLYELGRKAALCSRPPKTTAQPQMREQWVQHAIDAGFDLPAIAHTEPAIPAVRGVDPDALVAVALERLAESQSTWIRGDIAREIAALLPPGPGDGVELLDRVDELAETAARRCIELHPAAESKAPARRDGRAVSEHVTDRALTTPAVLRQEARLLDWADHSIEPAPDTVAGQEQQAAADAIAGTGQLVLIVGPAGAGKTTAIANGTRQLQHQGRVVVGLAPSGKAADVLATTTGARAVTLAKLLHLHHTGKQLPPPGATIVLDEAGMAATNDLDRLTQLCTQQRWRLVAVGDPAQLPAVARGGIFTDWTTHHSAYQLHEVRRFTHPWEARASLALRTGDPAAINHYLAHDRIRTVHPALLGATIAKRYVEAVARGETLAITTTTADTARTINQHIQATLRRTASKPEIVGKVLSVPLSDGTRAHVGDQIATRRNLHLQTDRGNPVRNRHTWTIAAINADRSVTVTNPEQGTVTLPADYVTDAVELGWAVTGYGNQGITTDHSLTVVEPTATRAGIYVGLTRGRHTNTALIPDTTGTHDPTDTLTQIITRPARGDTAHTTRHHLHQQHGIAPPSRQPTEPVPLSRPTPVLER